MQPLSPLDGRYAKAVHSLRPFFTEDALIRARLYIEVQYLIALSDERGIPECKIPAAAQAGLLKLVHNFSGKDADRIRLIEKKTNHDVKAVEYYLREQWKKIAGAKARTEFVHFALTSEDVNNLAYGVLMHDAIKSVLRPELQGLISTLRTLATKNSNKRMLSLTHGQPATPTTLGKEIMVFVDRLIRQYEELTRFRMQGKFGGAVANFSAHKAAYPDFQWERFGAKFVRSLKLDPIKYATQINPHDDMAEVSHIYCRINTILLDFSRDVWMYVSRGIFKQRTVAGEVGSSTMPHKVNPIDFENAEGNLGLSSALFSHFAEKLPISRLQRDLSDSTVQRSIGVAFGYHVLAISALRKGLKKLAVNSEQLIDELHAHPEVMTEAIQTVMRKHGYDDAYERMKALSRGKRVTWEALKEFVSGLEISKADKERLVKMLK
ncbi:MAG: adenylosuccinate lyase [Candidatus Peribacteraceae bacterium]